MIPTSPADACVEVPCDVDGSGVHPIATGPLPPQCAAYVHPAVDCQALDGPGRARRGPRPHLPRGPVRPQVQARLTLDEAWRHDRRAHRRRGALAAGVAGRIGTRLDSRSTGGGHHVATPELPRRLARAPSAAALAVVVGGLRRLDDEPGAGAPARPSASAPALGRAGWQPAASPAATRGPPATIEYSIWGDPPRSTSQTKLVESFEAANPTIDVKVTVADWDAYWEKLLTGLAGGAAPDVFAMDGPLFPDYQARDVLLDLQPFIERDGYDLTQLADQGVGVFKTAEGGQFGLPRDLNVVVLYYNKAMFDAAGVPYPDDTWDWAKLIEVGKQLTLDTDGDGTTDQWGLYTETSDMENYWLSLGVAERRRLLRRRTGSRRPRHRRGGRRHPVPPGPHLQGEDPRRAGGLRRDRRRVRAGAGRHGGQRLVARADPPGRRASTSASRRSRPDRRADSRRSTRRVRSCTRAPSPRTPPGSSSKYLASPAAQEQLMQLKASLPVSKEVLAGPYATSFDGAQVFADSLAYAKAKPSFAGYEEYTTILQGELDENVFNAPNKTAKEAVERSRPQLERPARAARASRRARRSRSLPRGRRSAAAPVAAPRGRDGWWALLFLAPTLLGLAVLSAGPIVASFGISLTDWDLLSPP